METNVFWGVHGALAAGANPSVLMLGDSWFWYPMDNLALELGASFDQQQFVVAGKNGAEAAQWSEKERKDIDFAFKMYGKDVQAFMLSGGGNDVAGMSDFLRLIRDNCSKAQDVAGCYREGQPDAIIAKIVAAYREVTLRFRAYNSKATVFLHDYDNAWPTGKGVFGPADWLKAPMDRAKVPKELRRPLFRDLLAQLRKGQLALAKEKAMGPMVAIASAGTLPESASWWANELHPTPAGFELLVKKTFAPALRKINLT
jgi:hypothetical protein